MEKQRNNLRSRWPIVTLLVLALTTLSWAGGASAEDPPSPGAEDFLLFRLINEARAYPSLTLERLGIDVEEARRAMGDNAWVLDVSLPPLSWKPELVQAAEAHRRDMLAGGFYSHTGSDGSGVTTRVESTGYRAVMAEELLGLLNVVTFVDGREAVDILFEQWLRDEVLSTGAAGLVLLNPLLTQIGLSVQPEVVKLTGSAPTNAYMAVAVLARPTEKELMAVGNLRPPQADLWLDPDQVRTGYYVVCRASDETVLWSGLTDPWGGYQCPMPGQTAIVEVVDAATLTPVLRTPVAGTDENLWADIALPW